MVKRIGSARRKTRKKFRKPLRERGRLNLTRYLQTFKVGDKVVLKADPSVHEGLYHPRFHSKSGEVIGMQGDCYLVRIKDASKYKQIIVHPAHLKRV
ncbi:50S ribosomal protein L21e [Candidatus Woesearchaeota archaeon]|mgnify:CR=1 FL=1|nr:50S ribosomal protein L21e [Candidatus Woesearchaeota archaeon]RLE42218.1 MAG: 50S ribosomal protein L21e [Candidatus Woesearchaeota archaeon]